MELERGSGKRYSATGSQTSLVTIVSVNNVAKKASLRPKTIVEAGAGRAWLFGEHICATASPGLLRSSQRSWLVCTDLIS